MFEKIIEKTDLRKYNFDSSTQLVLNEFFNKEEFIEILDGKHSLLGVKAHDGKEVVYTKDENLADFLRTVRDEFGEWHKFIKIPFNTEKHFDLHFKKLSLMENIRHRLGANFVFNKKILKKKLEVINQKLQKTHERLQGVFVVSSEMKDLFIAFDSRSAIFATKITNEDDSEKLSWLKDVKKAALLIICPDNKQFNKYTIDAGCEKLKVGRTKNKNIWVRQA